MDPDRERPLGLDVVSVDEVLRTVIRNEMAKTGLTSAQVNPDHPKPTKGDLILLSVVAADCALILVLVPSLENSAVETFLKVVQWTGATVFVAAATWFQEQFLSFTRGMTFRAIAVLTLLVLLPQKVPLVPILVPQAAEDLSDLKFDTDSILNNTGRRMVTLASHTLTSTTTGQLCSLQTQPALSMGVGDLWSAVRRRRVVPLYYGVNATFPFMQSRDDKHLRITRRDDELAAQDLAILRRSLVQRKAGRLADAAQSRDVAVAFGSNDGAAYVELPGGSYGLELRTGVGACLGRVGGQLRALLGSECVIEFAPAQCGAD